MHNDLLFFLVVLFAFILLALLKYFAKELTGNNDFDKHRMNFEVNHSKLHHKKVEKEPNEDVSIYIGD